ncbi:MAG TPA: LamG domain-containing protein, partial [Ramlibacter sp.]|nr:LamG domain-containing protein [Ramlibacter sp.]
DHFLFSTPLRTGLVAGETFGHGPAGSLPRAVGHEWDLTISTLLNRTDNIPGDAVLPRPQEGIVVLAQGVRRVPGEMDAYLDFFERAVQAPDGVSAEMIYWERPQGGRVFNAGSVGASWVLRVDDAFAALLANVLAHFGIPVPGPVLPQIDETSGRIL